MHDPARLANALGRQQRQRLFVGVAAVDDHGLSNPARQRQLGAERALLRVAGRQVAEEVEPRLADGDHPRRGREPLDLLERGGVRGRGIVWMNADRRPDVGLTRGERHRGPRGRDVGTDRQEA